MVYTMVYDSGCGPCTRFREAVSFLDPKHGMRYLGLDDAEAEGVLASVPEVLRRRSFHLVSDDGSALSGRGALATLASQLPCGAVTGAALRSGPLSRVAGFAYATLSRLHDTGACALEQRRDVDHFAP